MEGWIKLHRKTKDHWLYPSGREFTDYEAWQDLLLEVNHKPKKIRIKNKLLNCERGQSLRSMKKWADRWSWSKPKVYRFFELLKEDGMIETVSETVTTRITICKYDNYQSNESENETHLKRNRNGSETEVKRTCNASETTPYTNKNEKNEKNEEECKEVESRAKKSENDESIESDEEKKDCAQKKEKFSKNLVDYLDSGRCPKFFWECFDILIDWANSKDFYIDFDTYSGFQKNRDAAKELFNKIRNANGIPDDGTGIEDAINKFLSKPEKMPDQFWLKEFNLAKLTKGFESIHNFKPKNNEKPDPRFDDRKSKFKDASKRRGQKIRFT